MANKIHQPCYFFNTGGCYHNDGRVKTGDECKYLHVKVQEPLEKPQHLKPPCKYYHLRGHCKNPYCIFGHSELTADRWKIFFPTHNYPGTNYIITNNFVWNVPTHTEVDLENSIQPNNALYEVKKTILLMMLQIINELPE